MNTALEISNIRNEIKQIEKDLITLPAVIIEKRGLNNKIKELKLKEEVLVEQWRAKQSGGGTGGQSLTQNERNTDAFSTKKILIIAGSITGVILLSLGVIIMIKKRNKSLNKKP